MLGEFVITHRAAIVVAFLVVLAVSGAGVGRLELNPNNRVFFGDGDSQYAELLEFEADFDSNTHLMFAISAETDLFSNGVLIEATNWLTEESWDIENVLRVDSISTYPKTIYDETDLLVVTLASYVCPQNLCQSDLREELFKPHLVNRFVSVDGRTLAVIVTVGFDVGDSDAVTRINQSALDLRIEFLNRFPNLELHYTGAVPMMQAFMDAADKDSNTLMIAAIAVIIVLLGIFLGSVVLTSAMIALGLSAIVITMGLAGWFGHILNNATSIAPVVMLTLVTAGAMHVFLHIARDQSFDAESLHSNIRRSISANQIPVLLTTATSVVGLLSMLFVSAPPIRQLGVLSAVGVSVGTILLLTVVPAFLSYFSGIRPSRLINWLQRRLNNFVRRIEHGTDRTGFTHGIPISKSLPLTTRAPTEPVRFSRQWRKTRISCA